MVGIPLVDSDIRTVRLCTSLWQQFGVRVIVRLTPLFNTIVRKKNITEHEAGRMRNVLAQIDGIPPHRVIHVLFLVNLRLKVDGSRQSGKDLIVEKDSV